MIHFLVDGLHQNSIYDDGSAIRKTAATVEGREESAIVVFIGSPKCEILFIGKKNVVPPHRGVLLFFCYLVAAHCCLGRRHCRSHWGSSNSRT